MCFGGNSPSGNTTSTQTQSPWTGQIPYLAEGLAGANNLYQNYAPQYYPGQTYAQPTAAQMAGINMQEQIGLNGLPTQGAASNTAMGILDPNFTNSNPSNPTYNNASSGGLGINTGSLYAPFATGQIQNTNGFGPLNAIASGQGLNTAGQGTLQNAANGGMNNNASTGFFSNLANGGLQNTAGTGTLGAIAGGQFQNLPGMNTLANIAGGANLSAGNPYFQSMADQIKANVLPTIDAQFASGNRSDSGLASRAEGEGLGSAIGNLAYQNYQQGLQQQQGAAGTLAGLAQGNVGQQAGAAGMLSNIGQANIANRIGGAEQLSGINAQDIANRLGAANSLGQFGAQNLNAQMGAASQLGQFGQANIANMLAGVQGLTGVEQGNVNTRLLGAAGQSANYSDALKNQIQTMALTPAFQSMAFGNAGALQGGGQAEQGLNQQAINDAVQRWNYNQQLPYDIQNQFQSSIGGNLGYSQALTQPYFQNGAANLMSTGLGALALNNGLGNPIGSLFGGGSSGGFSLADMGAGGGYVTNSPVGFGGSGLWSGIGDAASGAGDWLSSLFSFI